MAVAGVGVDDRYHPVLGHFAGNAENAVIAGLYVLADHGGQQLGGRGDGGGQLGPVEDGQTGVGILGRACTSASRAAASSQSQVALPPLA
jgi:hypothetical protein